MTKDGLTGTRGGKAEKKAGSERRGGRVRLGGYTGDSKL